MRTYRITAEDSTKPHILDISAEETFEQRYDKHLKDLELKAQGSEGDPEEVEKVYQEIKMVLKELENIEESFKNKNLIQGFKSKFEKILKKYFSSKYAKDMADEKQGEESSKSTLSDVDGKSENTLVSAPPPEGSQAEREMAITPSAPAMAHNKTRLMKLTSFIYPPFDNNIRREVLEHFANHAIEAIKHKHKGLGYTLDIQNNEIKITDANAVIIKIKINEFLNVTSIIPSGSLYQICPYHSVEFYQKYWKPIVESIGHFCIGDPSILLAVDNVTLPDVPKNRNVSFILECWDTATKKKENIALSFKGEKPIWVFEKESAADNIVKTAQQTQSKYMETDYLNAVVKCIDPRLKSIYGRTGAAIQVIPSSDVIEIDVDFGRGLEVVRLTEKQIEIVPLG